MSKVKVTGTVHCFLKLQSYLKNWSDNFFKIFFMGTSWVALSIKNIKTQCTYMCYKAFILLVKCCQCTYMCYKAFNKNYIGIVYMQCTCTAYVWIKTRLLFVHTVSKTRVLEHI